MIRSISDLQPVFSVKTCVLGGEIGRKLKRVAGLGCEEFGIASVVFLRILRRQGDVATDAMLWSSVCASTTSSFPLGPCRRQRPHPSRTKEAMANRVRAVARVAQS